MNQATSLDKIRVWECKDGKAFMLYGCKCPKCQNIETDNQIDNYSFIRETGCCVNCWANDNIKSITIIG